MEAEPWQSEPIGFMCECGDVTCTSVIRLKPDEYERLRIDPAQFVVLPGHDMPDLEDVVEHHNDYFVVKKHAETAQRVTDADPRT
jgi:hypothetical protein